LNNGCQIATAKFIYRISEKKLIDWYILFSR